MDSLMHLRLELAMCEAPAAADALRAVLLFHKAGPWTLAESAEWERLTGTTDATTKNLCDTVRAALGGLDPLEGDDDAGPDEEA
jgi:hypothetical protein